MDRGRGARAAPVLHLTSAAGAPLGGVKANSSIRHFFFPVNSYTTFLTSAQACAGLVTASPSAQDSEGAMKNFLVSTWVGAWGVHARGVGCACTAPA